LRKNTDFKQKLSIEITVLYTFLINTQH